VAAQLNRHSPLKARAIPSAPATLAQRIGQWTLHPTPVPSTRTEPHHRGSKVSHGPGLRSIAAAQKAWDVARPGLYAEYYGKPKPTSETKRQSKTVAEFITNEFEPRMEWEDNSRINWEYYREGFLIPTFGKLSLADMNDEQRLKTWITKTGERYSYWTTKKALDYVRAVLKLASALGLIVGNSGELVKIPKSVKKPKAQPALTMEQFGKIYNAITNPRDRLLLKILFLDWDGKHRLKIERSLDAQTHKVKGWSGKVIGPNSAEVAIPPGLAEELNGWKRYGNTDASKDSYIFPTRNGTPILARNWSEDVLKPAGKSAGIPGVSFHWFRRCHATIQHFGNASDKAIQGQLRHSKAETKREVYMQQVSAETLAAVAKLETSMLAATARAMF